MLLTLMLDCRAGRGIAALAVLCWVPGCVASILVLWRSCMKPKSEAQDRAQTRRAIYQRQRQAAADALRALQALQPCDPEPGRSSTTK